MDSLIYNLALLCHIAGICILAGTTVVDIIMTRQFWSQYQAGYQLGLAINHAMSKYYILQAIGIVLLVLSGVAMMFFMHLVFGTQVWFRIKFVLVIIVIVNGLAVGRKTFSKLTSMISLELYQSERSHAHLMAVKRRTNLFHFSQVALLIVIFTLSIFKFN